MARLCGTKLSKDARTVSHARTVFTFSGPKKYTRLSPVFVARIPQENVSQEAGAKIEVTDDGLTRDAAPIFDQASELPKLAKNIKSPCPVPEDGIARVAELYLKPKDENGHTNSPLVAAFERVD